MRNCSDTVLDLCDPGRNFPWNTCVEDSTCSSEEYHFFFKISIVCVYISRSMSTALKLHQLF